MVKMLMPILQSNDFVNMIKFAKTSYPLIQLYFIQVFSLQEFVSVLYCTLRRILMKYYVILECKNKSNCQMERAWIPLIN